MLDKLLDDLKSDEGWRPHAYQDTLGLWTIGYGFLVDDRRPGEGLPAEIAEAWLAHIVERNQRGLRTALTYYDDLPEPVQRALSNMCYQMGLGGLLGFRNTLRLIHAGKYAEAADEALNSRWARQTPNRAKRVTDLIRSAA